MGAHSGRRVQGNLPFVGAEAIGGTVMDIEQAGIAYRVHAFTDVGEHNFEVIRGGEVDVLVVAGGGGGGNSRGGGGGAGGLILRPKLIVSSDNIPIFVGSGGLHISGGNPGTNGENSSFDYLVAIGGGGGGAVSNSTDPNNYNGKDGGSGGGARRAHQNFMTNGGAGLQPTQSGDSGSPYGFGNDGASSNANSDNQAGGGGAGGPGIQGSGISSNTIGGVGLNEVTINGSLYNFAKMFGTEYGEIINGEAWFAGGGAGDGGLVSKGGGGEGSRRGNFSAQPNTGGGGGGSSTSGGTNGGSGIVIVRYVIPNFPVRATGGTETEVTEDNGIVYRVHSFTDVGSDTFEVTQGGAVEYLIAAGGGGGGSDNAGGGGGGGVLSSDRIGTPLQRILPHSYNVTVGAGGNPSGVSNADNQTNGGDSSIFGLVALGGGFGGNGQVNARPASNGGSGGGGHGELLRDSPPIPDYSGGSGVIGQGFDGGDGTPSTSTFQGAGGGGGGSNQEGETAVLPLGGKGGDGLLSKISGNTLFYGSGGGGGSGGVGANGGGGAGSYNGGGDRGGIRTISSGESASNNTGGGGGGSERTASSGGAGGSGIVIVRYPAGFRLNTGD